MKVEDEFPELLSGVNKLLRKIEDLEFTQDLLRRRVYYLEHNETEDYGE